MAERILGAFASRVSGGGEVFTVAALKWVIDDPDLETAFREFISSQAGVDAGAPCDWLLEATQDDSDRPDMEARRDGLPVMKVEAKLGAPVGPDQVMSYARDQRERISAVEASGLVALLVPENRRVEANNVFDACDAGPRISARAVSLSTRQVGVVISWEEVLDHLADHATGQRVDDIRQLQDLYRELVSLRIAPILPDDLGENWENRRREFSEISYTLTSRLAKEHLPPETKLPPIDDEQGYWRRRYVCIDGSCFSIGLRHPPENSGADTPLWLRFNRHTKDFNEVLDRLQHSRFAPALHLDGENLWLPLHPPEYLSDDPLIDALQLDANEILAVAWPHARLSS